MVMGCNLADGPLSALRRGHGPGPCEGLCLPPE